MLIKRATKAILPHGLIVIYRRVRPIVNTKLIAIKQKRLAKKQLDNLLSSAKFIKENNNPKIVVSLTSYGHRINKTAPLAIASLLNQSVLPDKMILWLAHGENIPHSIKQLIKFGLEVRYTDDIKSYKKLIPALKEYPESSIITVDDDIIYPEDTLELLITEHTKNPQNIVAHRVRKITTHNNRIQPYVEWPFTDKKTKNSSMLFPNSGAGVLYPPHIFDDVIFDKKLFMNLTPSGDDIWFWAMGALKDTKITIVKNGHVDLKELDLENGLWLNINTKSDGNDLQIYKILKHFPELQKKLGVVDMGIVAIRHEDVIAKFNIVNPNDWITKIQLATQQFYEIEMLKDIENRLHDKKNNVIIDAGTYIGNHTIFFALYCNASTVISFEPSPESFKKLVDNIKLNNLEGKIDTHNVGLGEKTSKASIDTVDGNNLGANKVQINNSGNIKIVTLDSVVAKLKSTRVDCIKIDVEGMEIPLIKGALKTIDKFSPLLYIEAFEQNHLNNIIKILSPLGYRITDVFNATPTYLFVREGMYDKSRP